MPFYKRSSLEIFGVLNKGAWRKSASSKFVSHYMEKKASDLSISLEGKLAEVADSYKISKDPSDYLLIPARANSIGRLNANLDGWTYDEIISFRPEFGCRTYSTYNSKPHFVEHQSSRYEVARGFILDSHLNLDNDADEETREDVFRTIGSYPSKDGFVEAIIAMDQTKDPALAKAYKSGAIKTFSMGADVEATCCNVCGNVASTTFQFCNHVKDKFSRREYRMDDGSYRIAGELCMGTVFQELSVVADPADKTAVIQDGLLSIQKAASVMNLSNSEIQELVAYTVRNAKVMPESLARILNSVLLNKGN
jgi:hypothetical protein